MFVTTRAHPCRVVDGQIQVAEVALADLAEVAAVRQEDGDAGSQTATEARDGCDRAERIIAPDGENGALVTAGGGSEPHPERGAEVRADDHRVARRGHDNGELRVAAGDVGHLQVRLAGVADVKRGVVGRFHAGVLEVDISRDGNPWRITGLANGERRDARSAVGVVRREPEGAVVHRIHTHLAVIAPAHAEVGVGSDGVRAVEDDALPARQQTRRIADLPASKADAGEHRVGIIVVDNAVTDGDVAPPVHGRAAHPAVEQLVLRRGPHGLGRVGALLSNAPIGAGAHQFIPPNSGHLVGRREAQCSRNAAAHINGLVEDHRPIGAEVAVLELHHAAVGQGIQRRVRVGLWNAVPHAGSVAIAQHDVVGRRGQGVDEGEAEGRHQPVDPGLVHFEAIHGIAWVLLSVHGPDEESGCSRRRGRAVEVRRQNSRIANVGRAEVRDGGLDEASRVAADHVATVQGVNAEVGGFIGGHVVCVRPDPVLRIVRKRSGIEFVEEPGAHRRVGRLGNGYTHAIGAIVRAVRSPVSKLTQHPPVGQVVVHHNGIAIASTARMSRRPKVREIQGGVRAFPCLSQT